MVKIINNGENVGSKTICEVLMKVFKIQFSQIIMVLKLVRLWPDLYLDFYPFMCIMDPT